MRKSIKTIQRIYKIFFTVVVTIISDIINWIICTGFKVEASQIAIQIIINTIVMIPVTYLSAGIANIYINKNIIDPIIEIGKWIDKILHGGNDEVDLNKLIVDNEIQDIGAGIAQIIGNMNSSFMNEYKANQKSENLENEIDRIKTKATHDVMTGVLNKTAYLELENKLNEKIKTNRAHFTIIMIDLNRLKKVNDTYGHEHGDEYIMGACNIIKKIIPANSLFRTGGDEFVAVIVGEDHSIIALQKVEKLRAEFYKYAYNENLNPWNRYSAAIGVADFDKDDVSVHETFKKADKNMYENKLNMKEQRTD